MSLTSHRRRLKRWDRWAWKVGPEKQCPPGMLRAYNRWARAWNQRQNRILIMEWRTDDH